MKWFDPSSFNWNDVNNAPPLSSVYSVTIASLSYVAFVIISTELSKKFLNDDKLSNGVRWKPWFFGSDLKLAQFVHNVVLIIISAAMFTGVVLESYNRAVSEKSSMFLLCESSEYDDELSGLSAAGALYFWSYMYYLSKYYELLDTVLQLARGKSPPHFVLHVYHHGCVLWMSWAWLEYRQSLQFIGLAFNCAVHVVMYTYFLQRTITSKVPKWKSLVTLIQIIQFVVSMICTLVTLYLVFVVGNKCAGMGALFCNVLFNMTLLHSFIGVFLKGRKPKKTEGKKL